MSAKEFRRIVFFILTVGAIVAVRGATVNGKHYGVRGCDCVRGVEIDVGEPPPDGGQ